MRREEMVEDWFLQYGDDVYRFLVYYTGSFDVEDLVQEVFLRALHSRAWFKGTSSPKTWLLAIARRQAVDQQRKARKWMPIDEEKRDPGLMPEDLVIQDETLRTVYEAIHQLKTAYRHVLLCRLVLDYSVEETAEVLRWPKPKVTLTYHRAIQRLKKQLGGMIHEQ